MRNYIVRISNAKMPVSCWGRYKRIAVIEVEPGVEHVEMISKHARGVVSIIETWEKLHVGSTERCAFGRALVEAEALCERLNDESEAA